MLFVFRVASSFDEGSNSTFDDTREEPKGSPLGRFSKSKLLQLIKNKIYSN